MAVFRCKAAYLLSFLAALSCISPLALSFNLSTTPFKEGYLPLFGDQNMIHSADGMGVRLVLNRYTGSGFISSKTYDHGLISASIKLPSKHTAGVVVAFYTSNENMFKKNHDELDFEFLGNIAGKPWRVQTNVYGNGSVSRGREERYEMWFDPTRDFHRYTILLSPQNIIFYIDDTPIREVVRSDAMGSDFPSKPMFVYATIWDASSWATAGGRYRVKYKYGPFGSEFTDLILHGCAMDPIEQVPTANCSAAEFSKADFAVLTPEKRLAMQKFRERFMSYSHCHDRRRYPVPLPECAFVESERQLFKDTGRRVVKFNVPRRRQWPKKQSRFPSIKMPGGQGKAI